MSFILRGIQIHHMRILNTTKVKFLVTLLAFSLVCGPAFAAASAAKQLAKGKELYAQNKNDEAMDLFIDVLVSGSRAESEEANRYINLIHNRVGGIQDPVEVDVNFKEGEARRLQPGQDPAVLDAQMAAENAPIEGELYDAGLTATAEQDAAAMVGQEQTEEQAAADQAMLRQNGDYSDAVSAQDGAQTTAVSRGSSTFTDLTSPSALKARQLYTSQKLQSMKYSALAKLQKTKGVRVYLRNDLPDAIDIDSEVLFNGYKFRPEAQGVLDEIYTLMALTQGAEYIILPPGSYTDNITLAGIRQAMALNSFLVHKGLSSGKISYNMGLFDQEPPAKFANLEGVSIVFDFDAELPASMPQAAAVNKLPMLSMAVVPVSNKIDPSAGEAFAIDFSVIETVNPIENWVFQVVQHAANGSYYVVRQLEGFAPVYHQLVWNGRKGIIGPELACGTYTLALTATDSQGGKRTVRRQIEVACTTQKAAAKQADKTAQAGAADKKLNYKTPRLWTKPARVMKAAAEPAEAEIVDPFAATAPATQAADAYAQQQVQDPYAVDNSQNPYAAAPAAQGVQNPYATGAAQPDPNAAQSAAQGVANPYDMPYEQYGN